MSEQGGPGSFLAISIRFFIEGIDFERIGFRFRPARFDSDSIRNDSRSAGSMVVSKGFLINFNSRACDSIFDLDSLLNFDSIACGSFSLFFVVIIYIFFYYLFIYLFILLFMIYIYIHTNIYIRRHTYINKYIYIYIHRY